MQQAYPENYPASAGFTATAVSLRDELTRGFRPTLGILIGAAGFLLLIVCASVANLMLARLLKREREMAIRMSLGAGRWRLVRQLLTESTLLALAGATVGLLLAFVTMDLLVTLSAQFTTRAQEISLNGTVLLFTLGIAVATGVLVGAIPALPGRDQPVVGDSGRRPHDLRRPRFDAQRAHRRAGCRVVHAAHRRRIDAAQHGPPAVC